MADIPRSRFTSWTLASCFVAIMGCDCGEGGALVDSGAAARAAERSEGDGFLYAQLRPHAPPEELSPTDDEGGLGDDWVAAADESVPPSLRGDLRAVYFDVETGTFPNEHDELLRRLAELAPTALPGVRFDEQPPTFESGEPYVLIASVDGQSHAVEARDLEDWFDVEAVIGMLNSLAREHHSQIRWQQLPAIDQGATIVVGPGPIIERAVAEGLLARAAANHSRALGQAAEEEVLDRIKAGGL